jgi:hypothetical protein
MTVTLTNVTLTGNRANTGTGIFHGGGLLVSNGSPVLHNTLIAGNFIGTGTTRDDVYGALDPSSDYNLIGDGTNMSGLSDGVNGNLIGSAAAPIDPMLGSLQNKGGPTQTMALLRGSPAIDAGNNAYATMWDQRGEGFPRIENGIIDIGAFEYHFRQPQLDPNPVPAQPLEPPGSARQESFGPSEQPVVVPPQQSGAATVQPGQLDTRLQPVRTSAALSARDAVLEVWSDPLADVLAAL